MLFFLTNYLIIIPNFVNLFFFKSSCLFVVKFEKKLNYLRLPVYYSIIIFRNKIFLVINFNLNNATINLKNNFKNIFIFINKCTFEILVRIYKKLNIMGIGFKIFKLTYFLTKILVFKLGFSHSVYLKIQNNIMILCSQYSKLFIFSNLISNIAILVTLIKAFKSINIYTGKGIFFYNQIIKLGKKIRK